MSDHVCDTCNDTHLMDLHDSLDEVRKVMCTRCPTPCQKCRAGGNGAFCETTPCPCECHGAQPIEGNRRHGAQPVDGNTAQLLETIRIQKQEREQLQSQLQAVTKERDQLQAKLEALITQARNEQRAETERELLTEFRDAFAKQESAVKQAAGRMPPGKEALQAGREYRVYGEIVKQLNQRLGSGRYRKGASDV